MKPKFIRAFFVSLCCRRRCVQEEEYGHADQDDSQHTVEPTCLSAAYIADNKLRIPGGKEPLPVKDCRQQGNDACQNKNSLDDVLAHLN